MGMVERSVALAKLGLDRIISHSGGMNMEMAVRRSCIARNNLPLLSSNLTPSFLMFGKASVFDVIEDAVIAPIPTLNGRGDMQQRHLIGILRARNEMMASDTERTLRKFLHSNIRPHSGVAIKIGEPVHVARQGKWTDGWGFLGLINNNAVVEKDSVLVKAPYTLIRRSSEGPILVRKMTPSATTNGEPAVVSQDQGIDSSSSSTFSAQPSAEELVRCALAERSMVEQPLFAAGKTIDSIEFKYDELPSFACVSQSEEVDSEPKFDPTILTPKQFFVEAAVPRSHSYGNARTLGDKR